VNYSEAIQFLYGLQIFGANFGLETPRKLATLAGDPQNRLRFIHVAGTNGKGSTCAMLESIYRVAGLRVGLFTSPHLVSFRERIQINRKLISESDIARLVSEIQESLKTFPADAHPTFFEVVTILALKFFAEQNCDLVIWETGLGGRLDATNIVTPLASVITNIAFDHEQWLGDTLGKIATEKAGIIKPGIPVVTSVKKPEVLAVIEKIAHEKNAPLTKIQKSDIRSQKSETLLGEHQKINAALAAATIRVLQKEISIKEKQIEIGLQNVNWPGRLQLVERPGGQKFLLDGAHNVAGAKVLREALEKDFPVKKRTLILGILQDKNWREICEMLSPLAGKIFVVPVASQRTACPNELAEVCRMKNPTVKVFAEASLVEALKKSGDQKFVVITGSLYLIGEALEQLGVVPVDKNERGLNEWSGGKKWSG
jgi:dihydrofolate synthase/folylpolyglutamate synthase